jgi:hypothetical protein
VCRRLSAAHAQHNALQQQCLLQPRACEHHAPPRRRLLLRRRPPAWQISAAQPAHNRHPPQQGRVRREGGCSSGAKNTHMC